MVVIVLICCYLMYLVYTSPKQVKAKPEPIVTTDPEPICDFCNDEPCYIGKSRIPCPKCKR